MKDHIRRIVVKLLKETADKIEAGNCEMTEEEAMDIMSVLSHQTLSKEQACNYLNIKRSRFDELVRDKLLPKGRKRRGFKELRWYQDEIDEYLKSGNP